MMTATIDLDLAGADELLRALAGAKAALTPGDHDLAAALIELPAPMSRGARPHGPARAHKAQSLRQEEREEKERGSGGKKHGTHGNDAPSRQPRPAIGEATEGDRGPPGRGDSQQDRIPQ